MKKTQWIILGAVLLLGGVSIFLLTLQPAKAPSPTRIEKPLAEMSDAERTAELEQLLNNAGIALPENWDQMSRQERGSYLIQNGLLEAAEPQPSNYRPVKVTGETCQAHTDCETPAEYLIQSNCPYTSLCLREQCVVVCPEYQ